MLSAHIFVHGKMAKPSGGTDLKQEGNGSLLLVQLCGFKEGIVPAFVICAPKGTSLLPISISKYLKLLKASSCMYLRQSHSKSWECVSLYVLCASPRYNYKV